MKCRINTNYTFPVSVVEFTFPSASDKPKKTGFGLLLCTSRPCSGMCVAKTSTAGDPSRVYIIFEVELGRV